MNDDARWDLLVMYVFEERPEEAKREVEAWLAGDPVRQEILDDLRAIYANTEPAPEERAEDERRQDRIWADMKAHIEQEQKQKVEQEAEQQNAGLRPAAGRFARQRRAARRSRPSFLRVAATAAAVAVIAVLVLQLQPGLLSFGTVSEAKAFATKRGERAQIRLAGGTRVHLNAQSRLEVLPGFGEDAREVRLQGQAYFEVATDEGRPFLVHAGPTTTTVLGTAFDVEAYSDEVEVVVAEGRVAFGPEAPSSQEGAAQEKGGQEDVVLTGRQAARLRPGRALAVREVDLGRHLAWLRGALVFVDAPFGEVAQKLERWYDVDVSLDGPAVPGQLTVQLSEEQPLEQVLTVIAHVFKLTYELEHESKGKVVTFSASNPRAP